MGAYSTPIKNAHRATVIELANADAPRATILYLDDEEAGATQYFLERGVPAFRLHAVNFSASACDKIRKLFPSVTVTCADINDLMSSHREEGVHHGVVWLDYTCRGISKEVLTNAGSVASYVMATLSMRGVHDDTIIPDLIKTIGACKMRFVESPARYQGKNGILNMLRFVAGGKNNNAPRNKETVAPHDRHVDVGQRVTIYWAGDKTWYEGTIVGSRAHSHLIRYDDGETKWHCLSRYTWDFASKMSAKTKPIVQETPATPTSVATTTSRRDTTPDVSKLIGQYVHMPKTLWAKKGLRDYHGVKRDSRGRLSFQIIRTHYKTNLAVRAIMKHSKMPKPALETWYLTARNVFDYMM